MSSSDVELVNRALSSIGNESILTLSDGTTVSNTCRNLYQGIVDATIRDNLWNSCAKRVQLALLTEEPVFGWTNQHQLPDDFLRVNRIYPNFFGEIPYAVEGQILLSDVDPVNLIYVARVGVNIMDASLQNAIVYRLAMALAIPIKRSESLQRSMAALYSAEITQAVFNDAIEMPSQVYVVDSWPSFRTSDVRFDPSGRTPFSFQS